MRNQLNLNFFINDVKELQSNKTRLRLLNFLKNKVGPKGIFFLQETHSSVEIEKKWIDDFNEKNCYSLGLYNSFGALSIDSSLR